MAANSIRFSFVKLQVEDMPGALAFWQRAFGFQVQATYDEPAFLEHILSLSVDTPSLSLILVQPRPISTPVAGTLHGPLGFQCSDIATTLESALAAGARQTMPITEVAPGIRVCLLVSPQGHEIELVQGTG
ncbi:MAG: VOC family protein [Alteraurantiacibacter sp.]|nr:VOC family protein [Alteraurantiacibacter sp.]